MHDGYKFDINIQGECLDIQDFMFLVNFVRLLEFLTLRGIIFHIFGVDKTSKLMDNTQTAAIQ